MDLWLCSGRLNTADVLGLSEEENLQLAARSVELIRSLDPETPVILSVDQPWGEYLSDRELDFPPMQFADTLIRAGVGISGLMLEMNVGYSPDGTLLRDPLEFSRRLDQWALFGLPLHVAVCVPSAVGDDPLARQRVKLPPENWAVKGQQVWISRYVPLILAKPYVYGVLWNQLRDSDPHDFPHGGLFERAAQSQAGTAHADLPAPGLLALRGMLRARGKGRGPFFGRGQLAENDRLAERWTSPQPRCHAPAHRVYPLLVPG